MHICFQQLAVVYLSALANCSFYMLLNHRVWDNQEEESKVKDILRNISSQVTVVNLKLWLYIFPGFAMGQVATENNVFAQVFFHSCSELCEFLYPYIPKNSTKSLQYSCLLTSVGTSASSEQLTIIGHCFSTLQVRRG